MNNAADLTGRQLGQYALRGLLGVGGMGAVYLGYQASLSREVAVKVLSATLADQANYIARFNREAKTAASLEHPHIVPVLDHGTQQGISYVVMRLLRGGTLAERLKQRAKSGQPLPSLGETAQLLLQLASALDYAHSQGVIHRDIKPSNVMFDNHGNPYIVDFGIAKLVNVASGLTATGMTVGTPSYMSPEQWRNEYLAAATDQYALGVMAYSLVTGRVPFEADTPFGLMHKHIHETPTPPQMLQSNIPDAVTLVLQRVLAKAPGDRFQNVTMFAQAFQRAVSGQEGDATAFSTFHVKRPEISPLAMSNALPPAIVSDTHPQRRGPFLWIGVGAIAAIMIALLAFFAWRQFATSGSETPDNTGQTAHASDNETATAVSQLFTPQPVLPSVTPLDTLFPTLVATDEPSPTQPIAAPVTDTLAPSETPDSTHTLTITSLPPATQTLTSTPTVTVTQTVTLTPTSIATETMTLTITSSATPTNTLTPAPTSTSIPSLTPIPLGFLPVAHNTDWQPIVREFGGVEMVLVPAGCFMMGSTSAQITAAVAMCESELGAGQCSRSQFDEELTAHQQCFERPFWMDRYEVTNAQFSLYNGRASSNSYWDGAQQPREQVTWFEARDFCELRGTRLPTEAEWEYAARGPDSWVYPWGNTFVPSNAVYTGNAREQSASVGSHPGNDSWVGAYDMAGNVWEWISTVYDESRFRYPYTTLDGRENNEDSVSERGLRGGGWLDVGVTLRTSDRYGYAPDFSYYTFGFRCVRSFQDGDFALLP